MERTETRALMKMTRVLKESVPSIPTGLQWVSELERLRTSVED